MNKKIIAGIVTIALGAASFATFALAESNALEAPNPPKPAVQIGGEGKVVLQGAKVTSVSSSTIMATLTWGSYNMPWTIKLDNSSEVVRRHGGKSVLSEIAVGHVIGAEGKLDTSVSQPTVIAKIIRDWSVEKINVNVFGVVSSVDSGAKSFMLKSQEKGNVKVITTDKTAFTKGGATTSFSTIKSGDLVGAFGNWDRYAKVVTAERVKIHLNDRRVFEGGKLVAGATGSSTPASIVVKFGRFDYKVNIDSDTAVLNSKWMKVPLSDFKTGDHIRVYGAADGTTIDATVVRDVSLR